MNKNKILLQLAKILNYIIPKNNRSIIIFSSPDYSDNSRIIYEKLVRYTGDKYSIVWDVENPQKIKMKHPELKVVRHKSLKSLWTLCRSKYIIRTHSLWGGIYVPGRQIMCYSYHGMGFKGFEPDIKNNYPHNSFEHFNVTSEFYAKMFSDALNADIDRFDITGLPRNDYLFEQPKELINLMNLGDYEKIIIWMPTFRESKVLGRVDGHVNKSGLPVVTTDGFRQINEIMQAHNYCLLVKMHQWAAETVSGNWSNIRIITNSDIPEPYSLYHLLGLMDVLLTDYSSVSTDFLLLNRPIGYVYDDIEEFRKSRYLPLDPIEQYMAGAIINTENQLFEFLDDLENDRWANDRERIASIFFKDRDNMSTERYLKAVGLL